VTPENINKYILATVCLHNFLRNREGNIIQFENNEIIKYKNGAAFATHIRDSLCNYFMTPNGMVDWQHDYVTRGQNQDFI